MCTSTPSTRKKILRYERDTASLFYLIQHNLEALQKSYRMAPVMKKQITLMQQGMEDYGMRVGPTPNRLFNLVPQTLAWFNRISCLTCQFWIDENDESVAFSIEALLSGLLHKTRPHNSSRVISFYFQHSKMYQPLASYLDFLLEDLALPMKCYIDILQEDVIFMLSFLMDPPNVDSEDGELVWAQLYATINKFPSLIHSVSCDVMNEEVCKAKLLDFLMKLNGLKAKVRELFLVIPYSSQNPSPTTNVTGFLNILVLNLRRMLKEELHLIPSLKHLCESLLNELVFIGPFLKNMLELLRDGEHWEILNLFSGIGNIVYNADYCSKLCFLRKSSVWYGMIALPKFIDDIKSIKIEINRLVGVENVYYEKRLNHHDQREEADALRPRGTSSEIERFSMGFREVEGLIINDLTRGRKPLTVISISGSGGQGKTTLAKRIYNDSNVRCWFQKSVWCYVSKDCPVKELLVQILHGNTKDGSAIEIKMEDLIERVWKSLKGRRFLIVLDDIWDIDAWGQLSSVFPDDRNGSRILFTSRNHDLASQVESCLISHPLPLFSNEESWELMEKILFGSSVCDKELVGIGKKIASCCKGLPLAVALTAGVLGRTEQNLDSWSKVEENLKTHLAREGCGNVLELSYMYLPDHLKSCFLYFVAFQRGENVRAARLKLLWIGEGFVIRDGGMERLKLLATEYLKDLVSQGLVIVTERSSKGGIKECNVHDLLYDLCLEKAKEDNFMHWAKKSVVDRLHKYNLHRLRVGEIDPFIESSHTTTPLQVENSLINRELPTSPLHSFLWSNYYSSAGREFSNRLLVNFKLLTVLKLSLYVEEFPEAILSQAICLRYLELLFGGYVVTIPPTIANLWTLITLIFRCYGLENNWLPSSMWDLESLRHVDVWEGRLDLESFYPKNSSKSNIETLGTIRLDKDDSTTVEILRRFPNLRKLKCIAKEREWHIMELLSMVGSILIQLETLNFCGVGNFEGHPESIVREFSKNENLTKLSLRETKIPWSVLSAIGKQLPNLLVLKLLFQSCVGRSWKLEDGDFSNLIYLKLRGLYIEEFDISSCDNPLPCLEHLVIERCWKLVEIPPALGGINTLKTIWVYECSKELKTSAMTILEEQREFGNETLQVLFHK